MPFDDTIHMLSERVRAHSSTMATEEAVKTAVVLPFFQALGYDVFNPAEVIPEFTADAVGKKGERVDYAIKINGEIRILVECKPIATQLDKIHLAQLFRYFTVTSAKFAILTNGRTFHFHTDLEEPNKLDTRPFLTFDLSDLQATHLVELRKFEKSAFDVDAILATAERLKYVSALKHHIAGLMDQPSEELVRLLSYPLHEGRFTAGVRDQFTQHVRTAFREIILESVKTRLSSSLADTEQALASAGAEEAPDEEEIVTTEEEKEGFHIIKAIVRDLVKSSRLVMRDAKSYCAVLIDNNNRRPLARMHFNRSVKYISLFDGEVEERVLIETLDHIYDLADRLRATASRYVDSPK